MHTLHTLHTYTQLHTLHTYNTKMMIILIINLLLLLEYGSQEEVLFPNNIWRRVSINSDIHEEKFRIGLMKGNIRCDTTFETLNIDDIHLAVMKDTFIQSGAIRHVSARKNLLKSIPNNAFSNTNTPYLLCLDLSKNKINLYKSNPFEHSRLRILNLSYQDMLKVQYLYSENEAVENINKLDKLLIFDNTNMHMPSLKFLDLTGNDFSKLLWSFSESFPQLTNLYLNNINAEILDPDFFYKIPKTLRVLHLENNYFIDLVLQDIAEITDLHLNSNPLKRIEIVSQKLRVLSLANCTSLSYANLNTPLLQYLDLSMNNLNTIPDFFFQKYVSLDTIILDHNKLSYVPVISDTKLIALSLSFNIITYIDENTFNDKSLTSLKKLSLKGNRIDRIEENAFSDLENLIYLDLSENKLQILPYKWLSPLTNLLYLNVISNKFENLSNLSVNLMSSVKHIFIKDNAISSVSTTELANLPSSATVYIT